MAQTTVTGSDYFKGYIFLLKITFALIEGDFRARKIYTYPLKIKVYAYLAKNPHSV